MAFDYSSGQNDFCYGLKNATIFRCEQLSPHFFKRFQKILSFLLLPPFRLTNALYT